MILKMFEKNKENPSFWTKYLIFSLVVSGVIGAYLYLNQLWMFLFFLTGVTVIGSGTLIWSIINLKKKETMNAVDYAKKEAKDEKKTKNLSKHLRFIIGMMISLLLTQNAVPTVLHYFWGYSIEEIMLVYPLVAPWCFIGFSLMFLIVPSIQAKWYREELAKKKSNIPV